MYCLFCFSFQNFIWILLKSWFNDHHDDDGYDDDCTKSVAIKLSSQEQLTKYLHPIIRLFYFVGCAVHCASGDFLSTATISISLDKCMMTCCLTVMTVEKLKRGLKLYVFIMGVLYMEHKRFNTIILAHFS